MRNSRFSETALLESLVGYLRSELPPSWTVSLKRRSNRADAGVDAEVRIKGPDGRSATVVIRTKKRVDPRDVGPLVAGMRTSAERTRPRAGTPTPTPTSVPMLLAPFLSPRTRQLLREAGVGYADLTGNLRLAVERPALVLSSHGADKNPWPEKRPLGSLKGPSAGRVVRALCDFRPPFGVRELAERAGVSPASVSRVAELLEREALVERPRRGPIVGVQWAALLNRWVQDYALNTSNRISVFIEPRGLDALRKKLAGCKRPYAITGSAAANMRVPVSAVRNMVVFVEDALKAARVLRLTATDAGANVVLAEPFDPVALEGTWTSDGLVFAALSQVVADLLSSGGRGPAEAEALIRWMEDNEDAWRA